MKHKLIKSTCSVLLHFVILNANAESSCEIVTELMPSKELSTIHKNVLCLHERVVEMQLYLGATMNKDLEQTKNSQYIRLTPSIPSTGGMNHGINTNITPYIGGINPCGQEDLNSVMACQEYLIRNMRDLCITGDCGDGLKSWQKFMPDEWREYINTPNQTYGFKPDEWLQRLSSQADLFVDDNNGQKMDMKKLFEIFNPSEILESYPNQN